MMVTYLNLFLGHINTISEVAPLDIVRLPLESKHLLEGASLLLICAFPSPDSRRVECGVEAIVLWAVGVHATEGGELSSLADVKKAGLIESTSNSEERIVDDD